MNQWRQTSVGWLQLHMRSAVPKGPSLLPSVCSIEHFRCGGLFHAFGQPGVFGCRFERPTGCNQLDATRVRCLDDPVQAPPTRTAGQHKAGFPSPIFCRQSSLARPVRRVQQAASSIEQRAWNMDFLGMMDGFVSIGLGKQAMEVAARTHGCQTRGIEAESPAANLIACTCLGSTDPSSQSPAVPSPTSQSKQTVCNPKSQTTDWPPDRKSRAPTPRSRRRRRQRRRPSAVDLSQPQHHQPQPQPSRPSDKMPRVAQGPRRSGSRVASGSLAASPFKSPVK